METRCQEADGGWKLESSYSHLPPLFYTKVTPTPVAHPRLVQFNTALAETLGLRYDDLISDKGVAILSGNTLPEGAVPLAQAYAGHQFGHFAKLGDGRALLIGEQMMPSGKRVDIQLKGSGMTPYSRMGDGRAALGPMLREYIISEAMYALGIPTTRSLAVVSTGEEVVRQQREKGAILVRVAASHLRVGTFQYAAAWGSVDDLQDLANYAIRRHFQGAEQEGNQYLYLLQQVIKRQASTIAKWQLVGFIHGVMNTDNMTISGETIDYGPCAFMNTYDPQTVFSSIDKAGRYAYGNQPRMAAWDLARFAEALLPLIDEDQEKAIALAEAALAQFGKQYQTYWHTGMRRKLGLFDEDPEDVALIQALLQLMEKYELDYTNTFVALTQRQFEQIACYQTDEWQVWMKKWQERLASGQRDQEAIHNLMKKHNPAVIPRNHRVEEALAAAVQNEDYSVMHQLLEVLANPYAYSQEQEAYRTLPTVTSTPYKTFCGT